MTWEAGLGNGRHHELSRVSLGSGIAFWGSGFYPRKPPGDFKVNELLGAELQA